MEWINQIKQGQSTQRFECAKGGGHIKESPNHIFRTNTGKNIA